MDNEWLTGWTERAGDVVAVLAHVHHRIHYSDDPRHHNRTMSAARAIFDRRFGGFRVPAPTHEMARLGINDGTHDPHGVTRRAARSIHRRCTRVRAARAPGDRTVTRRPLLLVLFALAACGRTERPATAPRIAETPSVRETQRCFADLRAMGVDFQPLPDKQTGPGCDLTGTVKLLDIGVPTANLGAIRCGEARAFAGWARSGVAPAAYQILGSELSRIVSMGSYACRNTVGTRGPARRSGHAVANAIDVATFELKDGRRISVQRDWNSPDADVRRFLQTIHTSACRRFGTVLSPDYNAAHHDHLHLEDDRTSFCR